MRGFAISAERWIMSKMTVRQLMKRPVRVVQGSTTLIGAREEMVQGGVRHLPVVDAGGVLRGLVSQRDIERALAILAVVGGKRQTLDVGDICAGEPLRVGPNLPAHEAAAMMIESHADALPVVDDGGAVVGIVTATDLIEVAREALLDVDPRQRARA